MTLALAEHPPATNAVPGPEVEVATKNYRFLQDHKRVRHLYLYGGAGSGKSWQIAIWFLLERLFVESNVNLLCVRKTRPAVESSCFQLFRDLLDAWGVAYRCNLTKLSIILPNGNGIFCHGLDKVEKKKSIEGINYVWSEEAIEITRNDATQLDLRARAKNVNGTNQLIFSFNPVNIYSWAKVLTDKPNDGRDASCHSTYLDNPFLSPEEIAVIEALQGQDAQFDKIYRLGLWASPTNVIYTNWQIKEISQEMYDYEDCVGGLDFGFNNATALTILGLRDDNVYILRELYGRGWTNTELISKMQSFWHKQKELTADCAEPDRIKEIRQAGFRCTASKKGKNSVTAGIDWLRARKIFVHPSCANTIDEFRMYKYKEDANENVFDEPVPFDDHVMDAVRYGVQPWRRRMSMVQATKRL